MFRMPIQVLKEYGKRSIETVYYGGGDRYHNGQTKDVKSGVRRNRDNRRAKGKKKGTARG